MRRFDDRRVGLGGRRAARGRDAQHRAVRAFDLGGDRNGFQQGHVLAPLPQHKTAVGQAFGHETRAGQQRRHAGFGRIAAAHAGAMAAGAQVAVAADEQTGFGRVQIEHLAQWAGWNVELADLGFGRLRVDSADGRRDAQRHADRQRQRKDARTADRTEGKNNQGVGHATNPRYGC